MVTDLGHEVVPIGVLFFNETDFPVPMPFLDPLFLFYRFRRIVVRFKPHQTIYPVLRSEA